MTAAKITPFLFEGDITVRVVPGDGAPWFIAADVCHALGLTDLSKAVGVLDDDERSILTLNEGGPDRLIISESGLFALILRSDAAVRTGTTAHRFRKWVTMEVLPSVRADRWYQAPTTIDTRGQSEAIKIRLVTEARQTFGCRASGELWFRLGLPIVPAMFRQSQQTDLFMTLRPTAS